MSANPNPDPSASLANSTKDAMGKNIAPQRNTTIQDATDDDPQDPMEKIIQQHGYPPVDPSPWAEVILKHGWPTDQKLTEVIVKDLKASDSRTKLMMKYFKSRESKKVVKSVSLSLLEKLPWLVYLILDKVFT